MRGVLPAGGGHGGGLWVVGWAWGNPCERAVWPTGWLTALHGDPTSAVGSRKEGHELGGPGFERCELCDFGQRDPLSCALFSVARVAGVTVRFILQREGPPCGGVHRRRWLRVQWSGTQAVATAAKSTVTTGTKAGMLGGGPFPEGALLVWPGQGCARTSCSPSQRERNGGPERRGGRSVLTALQGRRVGCGFPLTLPGPSSALLTGRGEPPQPPFPGPCAPGAGLGLSR